MKTETAHNSISKPKTLSGKVVSNKMKDTVVVVVERFIKHAKYQKYIQHRKRFKVHDEGNKTAVGDEVVIVETRPISRHKSFKILEVTKKALPQEA